MNLLCEFDAEDFIGNFLSPTLSLSHATELELKSSGDPRRRAPQVDDRDSK